MHIHLIATGGTFEKHYDELSGNLVFTKTHLSQILKRARVTNECSVQTVCLVDSLDMTVTERQKILMSCQSAQTDRIVIVHGTDTMSQTATVLGNAHLNKTIVLTGAMVPYEFSDSDALFNLGAALSCVQLLDAGVYICMNSKIFKWDDVKKNKSIGVFETLVQD